MSVRFFAHVRADDVGVPYLAVGTDCSMAEDPVIRVLGQDEHAEVLFDHIVPAFDVEQLRAVQAAIRFRLRPPVPRREDTPTAALRPGLESALELVERALSAIRVRDRVVQIVDALAEGEALQLGDEGYTLVRCRCEHPASYSVHRWGATVVENVATAATAAAVALHDHGLPPGEHVIGDG